MVSRQLICRILIAAESCDADSSVISAGNSLARSRAGKDMDADSAREAFSDFPTKSRRFIKTILLS